MANAWAGSDRRDRLPDNWPQLRRLVKARAGGRCEHTSRDGWRCRRPGTDCDHIVRGDNHDMDNLQWLCGPHHASKTALEGVAARRKKWDPTRPTSRHPGLVDV